MKNRNAQPIKTAVMLIAGLVIIACILLALLSGCGYTPAPANAETDRKATLNIGDRLAANQPTPTDIDYSLERYNLIRRAYWVNGQREKANTLISAVDKPLGYVVLFTEAGGVVGSFVVDGKITCLNSFLAPDSEYYEYSAGESSRINKWLPDVDGSYGENDAGIFFFTPDGKYIEWTGTYLYSDIPFEVANPVVTYEVAK